MVLGTAADLEKKHDVDLVVVRPETRYPGVVVLVPHELEAATRALLRYGVDGA